MNCPMCGREVRIGGDRTTHYYVPVGGHYWTRAERAGLKAMGKELIELEHYQSRGSHMDIGAMSCIRAYVAAARKAKEGK